MILTKGLVYYIYHDNHLSNNTLGDIGSLLRSVCVKRDRCEWGRGMSQEWTFGTLMSICRRKWYAMNCGTYQKILNLV